MANAVRKTIHRWARARNRRRFVEELLDAATWVAMSLVLAAGFIRLGDLLLEMGWVGGPRWPTKTAQWAFALWATGWVGKLAGTRALWRYRQRRTRPRDFAHWLDEHYGTSHLWVTALAIEHAAGDATHAVAGSPHLARELLEQARARLSALREPIEPFREPRRALAAVGIAAAVLAMVPSSAEALALRDWFADGPRDRGPAMTPAPGLDTSERATLEASLTPLEARYGVPPLAPLRMAIEEAIQVPEHALVALVRAERALAQLAQSEPEPAASGPLAAARLLVEHARQRQIDEINRAALLSAAPHAPTESAGGPPRTADAYLQRYFERASAHERSAP